MYVPHWILVLICMTTSTTAGSCPSTFTSLSGSCYSMVRFESGQDRSWGASRQLCRQLGADLAVLQTTDEVELVDQIRKSVGLADTDFYWIGLSDAEEEGVYVWVNGERLALSEAIWLEGEPEAFHTEEDYVAASSHGWLDSNPNWSVSPIYGLVIPAAVLCETVTSTTGHTVHENLLSSARHRRDYPSEREQVDISGPLVVEVEAGEQQAWPLAHASPPLDLSDIPHDDFGHGQYHRTDHELRVDRPAARENSLPQSIRRRPPWMENAEDIFPNFDKSEQFERQPERSLRREEGPRAPIPRPYRNPAPTEQLQRTSSHSPSRPPVPSEQDRSAWNTDNNGGFDSFLNIELPPWQIDRDRPRDAYGKDHRQRAERPWRITERDDRSPHRADNVPRNADMLESWERHEESVPPREQSARFTPKSRRFHPRPRGHDRPEYPNQQSRGVMGMQSNEDYRSAKMPRDHGYPPQLLMQEPSSRQERLGKLRSPTALDQLPLSSASAIASDTVLSIKMRAMAQALLQRSQALNGNPKVPSMRASAHSPELGSSLLTKEKRHLLSQLERRLVKDYLRIMMMDTPERDRPRFDPGTSRYNDDVHVPAHDYPPSQMALLPHTTPPPRITNSHNEVVDMKQFCVGAPPGAYKHPRDCNRYIICYEDALAVEFRCGPRRRWSGATCIIDNDCNDVEETTAEGPEESMASSLLSYIQQAQR